MAPIVDGLEKLYGEYVNFVVVDIDDNENLVLMEALGYSPRVRPGLYLLSPDGAVEAVWIGTVEGSVLQKEIVASILKYQN